MRHALKLSSPKLQRIHNVLLNARGSKLSTFELATRTKLCAVSTYISHLRNCGVPVEVDHVKQNGETIYRYWIDDSSLHSNTKEPAGVLEVSTSGEPASESMDAR